ncbi:MAG: hypothetical protein M2R45_00947 [Verrucomicrobia subdivision 3 bacterium]|nr:hypothetical protein [Limisphaerales bacterium]MCS1414615.1 hypothetical protein [Limisphaerales bacterium]
MVHSVSTGQLALQETQLRQGQDFSDNNTIGGLRMRRLRTALGERSPFPIPSVTERPMDLPSSQPLRRSDIRMAAIGMIDSSKAGSASSAFINETEPSLPTPPTGPTSEDPTVKRITTNILKQLSL